MREVTEGRGLPARVDKLRLLDKLRQLDELRRFRRLWERMATWQFPFCLHTSRLEKANQHTDFITFITAQTTHTLHWDQISFLAIK